MDDPSSLDPDFMMVLAALCGVWSAWERQSKGGLQATPLGARVLLLGFLAVIAIGYADTWRGVLYCTLMPLGAYKVAQVLSEPLWRRRVVLAEARRMLREEARQRT